MRLPMRALAVRPKVVFIGDSITEGWYSAHPSFFDANGFAARGISGQVTAQMLARFQCDVVALRPRAVVILAGTNDIARNNGPIDEERIADNIRSMAELARAHGMRVFLCSVLPAARYGWRPEVTDAPDRIDRLNRMLREYALDNGCEWVDFHPGLADADRALDARYTPRRCASDLRRIRCDGGDPAAVSEMLPALMRVRPSIPASNMHVRSRRDESRP